MFFSGQHEHTIDSKRRLAIPSHIRAAWDPAEHGAGWYAVPWIDGIIRLYPEKWFYPLARQAGERARSLTPDQDHAEALATLFGSSERLTMDSAGRVRLSEDMLELVGLGPEVVLVGVGDWMEIRDRAAWMAGRRDRLSRLRELLGRSQPPRPEEDGQRGPGGAGGTEESRG